MNLEIMLNKFNPLHKPKAGVAFSGGGARGFSHIGVLMALEKFGIHPAVLAGVSAGSIAATLYGAGLRPLEMRECFAETRDFADFRDWTIPKEGIFKLSKFARLLESWLPVSNLEDMPIPTLVCATNLDRGSQVAWGKGEIVPRVIASCSIPIVFCPVTINGQHYVDGGVLHNLPAWAIRKHCDVLYGSNCSPLNTDYKYRDSLMAIALRTYHLTTKSNVPQDMRLCDCLFNIPGMNAHKVFDLKMLDKAIQLGYETGCRVLEEIHSKRK